ncbi:wobble nucleotide-excising tRNase [Pedobacter sp. CAN_A7]|uniref:AAA family ATPase n=1 Tax=Pedobacter sp. CAN_A7 TaxID=2787722 RepID=UPI0018CB72DF
MINGVHLKNIATYDSTGVEIKNLKKINFIYGSNGSGKTTFTKYLFAPESYKDCRTTWVNDQPVKLLIYNKDFRERNFGKGNIDGVFTLGQATKEEAEKIEELKARRKVLLVEGGTKRETLKKMTETQLELDNDFRDSVWAAVYKKHEPNFKEGFRGYINNKESFKSKFLDENQKNKSKLLDLEKLQGYAQTIFGNKPILQSTLIIFEFDKINEIEQDDIWSKKIIGKSDINIANLIQKFNMNDWVNHGRSFLQGDHTCPFCQEETITFEFRKQLEDYFDETFIADTKKVKNLEEDYSLFSSNLLNVLHEIEINEKANKNSKLETELFSAYLKTLDTQFQHHNNLIKAKLKEPSRCIEIGSTTEQLGNIINVLEAANKAINQHNTIVNNFEKSKAELIGNIWQYVINDFSTTTQSYLSKSINGQKGIDGMQAKIDKLLKEYSEVNADIINRSKNLTSVQPSVDQINLTLKSYGFNNFMIVPSNIETNKYQIQREGGEMAVNTLSEGEITFITFLYFLQLTKGSVTEDNISEERILIVDDPISSLDSSILFVISSLLRVIIKDVKADKGNIKQLILLTHNVYFHKEVSFISSKIKECKNTNYWILRKHQKHTCVQSFLMINPIQSSYELLWKEIKNRGECSTISIQNTMRRILENYFKILGGISEDNIVEKFTIPEEKEICRSLMLWINDGSHSMPDDLFIEKQDDVIEKYFDVFKSIFIHTKHDQHFDMMIGQQN